MGPLTAPLLRIGAYNPLFDAPPEAHVPPALAACFAEVGSERCLLDDLSAQLSYALDSYAARCREELGEDHQVCALLNLGSLYAPGGLLDLQQLAPADSSPASLYELSRQDQGQELIRLLDALLAPLMSNLRL